MSNLLTALSPIRTSKNPPVHKQLFLSANKHASRIGTVIKKLAKLEVQVGKICLYTDLCTPDAERERQTLHALDHAPARILDRLLGFFISSHPFVCIIEYPVKFGRGENFWCIEQVQLLKSGRIVVSRKYIDLGNKKGG